MFFLVRHGHLFLCRLWAFRVVEWEVRKERGGGEKTAKTEGVAFWFLAVLNCYDLPQAWKKGAILFRKVREMELWSGKFKNRFDQPREKLGNYISRLSQGLTSVVDNDRLLCTEKTVFWNKHVLVLVGCLIVYLLELVDGMECLFLKQILEQNTDICFAAVVVVVFLLLVCSFLNSNFWFFFLFSSFQIFLFTLVKAWL